MIRQGVVSMAFDVGPVGGPAELVQIIELQQANLAGRLTDEQIRSQGFVTAVHTAEILGQMHALAPSIVARDGGRVVGYALTMLPAARALVPVLDPMFQMLETLPFRGHPLASSRFYVMGQVCIAAGYRGQGVFDALYHGHRRHYRSRYDLLVTEIAARNTRSLRAHERVGFEVLHTFRDATDDWVITGWDWS